VEKAREFTLPKRRRVSWWAIGVSIGLHALVLSVRATGWWANGEVPEVRLIPLSPIITTFDLDYQAPVQPPPARRPPPEPVEELVATEEDIAPPSQVPAMDLAGIPEAPIDTAAGEPSPTGTGPTTMTRLRPARGEGKLWVQPLPLAPKELAQRLTRSHIELIDSAVTVIVQAYIDSVVAAPTPYDNTPPTWTTEIGGRTFGIDSRNIYLGGLKIPTAILALLPIPQVSNVDLRAARRMADMREDLMIAAQRARTMEDFKKAIKALREERARQQVFERNQRREPGDTVPR